jgi:3-methyladenine DNA glycosylase AlkD
MGENRKTARQVKQNLKRLGNPERARFALRYFKTGPGQYGAGDRFLGISAPVLRKTAKEYKDLETDEILELLHSPLHEVRILALLIWNHQFLRGTPGDQRKIHNLYLKNSAWINNWDLVDCSAEIVVGGYLLDQDTAILNKLASSKNLWKRRIAMISTFAFIRKKRFETPLAIATRLMNDEEDLIHKACGWMLRELGKRDTKVLEDFLAENASKMPRTMLRYSIERFPEEKRKKYLLESKAR